MAIVLKLKKGESVERGLKRMKKILDKEGLLKTIRDTRYFEKPCVKARQEIPARPHPQPFASRPHGAQLTERLVQAKREVVPLGAASLFSLFPFRY